MLGNKKYRKDLESIAPLFLSSLDKKPTSAKRLAQRVKEIEQGLIDDCRNGVNHYVKTNVKSNRK